MDLSKPWSGAYNTTNSQYGAFDSKAAASMHASSTTAFSKLSITKAVPRTLLLVSDNLPEHELLIKATLATTTVVAVKYDSMSLADLGDAISKSAPAGAAFDAVGILDHGAPGRFCLLKSVGGGDIDLADLASSDIAAFLKALGGLVKPGGRIDLLGCSVAAGPAGRALLAQVEALTGVNVTASTDKTGGAADADWVMETDNLNVAKDYFDKAKVAAWKQAASFVEALTMRGPDEDDLDLRRELIREDEDMGIDHGPKGPGWIIDEEDDAIEKLTKLKEQFDVGAITKEEFDAKAAEHLKKL